MATQQTFACSACGAEFEIRETLETETGSAHIHGGRQGRSASASQETVRCPSCGATVTAADKIEKRSGQGKVGPVVIPRRGSVLGLPHK